MIRTYYNGLTHTAARQGLTLKNAHVTMTLLVRGLAIK